jgi:hypothetical protein
MNRFLCFSILLFTAFAQASEAPADGDYFSYNSHAVLVTKGQFHDGKMQGVWTRYYSTGQVQSVGSWKNDMPDGHWTFWYLNGKKKSEGEMSEGQRVGTWTTWDASGHEKSEVYTSAGGGFFKGQLHWKDIRVDGMVITQNSGGNFDTAGVAWNPLYQWSSGWGVRGVFGLFPVKSNQDGSFYVTDIEFLASYGTFSKAQIGFELGGGVQSWTGQSGSKSLSSFNVTSSAFTRYNVSRLLLGVSTLSYPYSDNTVEYRLGAVFEF